MDFSKRQADPRRHLTGIGLVIAFHALIVWALVSGLAKKVVEVVRAPIETKVIEEVKKPPPPPEIVVPPPPKLEAPPPPFIPPPEVQVTAPPPPQPTITATTPTPPPAPVVMTPQAPPVAAPVAAAPTPPAPPAPPPSTGPTRAGAVCQNRPTPEFPAVNDEVSGVITLVGIVKGGRVTNIEVKSNGLRGVTDPRTMRKFRSAVETAFAAYGCEGDGIQIIQEFSFKQQ